MQVFAEEIQIVIAVTVLLFMITSFVVVFIFIHQRKYIKSIRERNKLKHAYEQEILKAQLEMKEQTLHTISQEIHDNIGQLLSLAKLNLNTLDPKNLEKSAEKISSTQHLISDAIQDLRSLSKTLNSDFIRKEYLSQSLQFEVDLINKLGLIPITMKIEGQENPLDPKKQLIIFRIVQEVINNTIKHAKAKSVSIKLSYLAEKFILNITDDGKGFDAATINNKGNRKGTGIHNIYHRAKLIGAQLSISSKPAAGTNITLSIPIN